MVRALQFSLAFVFRQILCIAVLLALWRLFPAWKEPPPMDTFLRNLLVQWFILICASFVAGAFVGGFTNNAQRGAVVGLCISLPAVSAWLLYWLSVAMLAG